MGEGRRRRLRADEDVPLVEERTPRMPQCLAVVVMPQPVAMVLHRRARHRRIVGAVRRVERRHAGDGRLELRLGHARRHHAIQHVQVGLVAGAHVDGRASAVGNGRTEARQAVSELLRAVGDLGAHRRAIVGGPERHAIVGQACLRGPWQRELPAARIERVGPGHDVEGNGEVLGAACERPHHRDVRRRQHAGQRMPLRRHDVPRRLVPVHATEVRRVADRAADVAADLQRSKAGGQRGRRAAG